MATYWCSYSLFLSILFLSFSFFSPFSSLPFFFLPALKIFWDQWSRGPLYFPPLMVTVEDTDYSFEFSESYTANLHFSTGSESIPFVMPLDSALEQLRQETFNSFLFTIEHNTVSIFTDSSGILKVFWFSCKGLIWYASFSWDMCVVRVWFNQKFDRLFKVYIQIWCNIWT